LNQLLLAQERKDGKIHPEQEPDIIDWIFAIVGFLMIEALPVGGIIGFGMHGIMIGVIICVILAVATPYGVMNAREI
jgi:hypothetical protein